MNMKVFALALASMHGALGFEMKIDLPKLAADETVAN